MSKTADLSKEIVGKRIAGEIVLSKHPGQTIQKWRNIFRIPQRALADQIGIMPSVVSDYENSRRKSPGIGVIKKMVDGMIAIDEKNGGKVIKEFSEFPAHIVLSDAVLDLKEFSTPVSIKEFCRSISAQPTTHLEKIDSKIYGYTVVDSLKAITELPPFELVKLYGMTNERALIFTGTHTGKSSMVALKVTNLRPKLVILHGSDSIDELARRIADTEGIILASTGNSSSIETMISNLKRKFGKE